jgi:broad specificity phosphatase PhoE
MNAPTPTTPTRLLLLRHAETAAPDRYHGSESDIGLSDRGLSQAQSIAPHLARLRPAAVYSSSMLRARLTADPIALASGLEPIVVESLHERRMGEASQGLIAELRHIILDTFVRWSAGDLDATRPGAESYAEIRDRVVPPFLSLARSHPGETVIVVAHGVVVRVLLTSLPGCLPVSTFDEIAIRNGAINDLRFDGERFTLAGVDLEASGLA